MERAACTEEKRQYQWVVWTILAAGTLLRIAEYAECRSLWLDEAFLSLNIIERPLSELHKPLNYGQGAPLGFLIAQKLCVLVLGDSEYGLRFFPLLFGLVSLFVFAKLARQNLGPVPAILALILFAVTDPLIYFAAEAKQYGCDAAVAVVLLYAALSVDRHRLDVRRAAVLGALGAMAVFFSHPAVFILAGIGLVMLAYWAVARPWRKWQPLFILFTCWASGFALCYVINLRHLSNQEFFEQFWKWDFLPSLFAVEWMRTYLAYRFLNFLELSPRNLPLYFLFLFGAIYLAVKRRKLFFLTVAPLPFMLAASTLHKYPLFERFLVFLIPSALLYLAAGVWVAVRPVIRRKTATGTAGIPAGFFQEAGRDVGSSSTGYALLALVLAFPVYHGAATLWTPRTVQDMKPILQYIKAHEQPGDVIYVFHLAAYPFKYYAGRYGFNDAFDLPKDYVDPDLSQRYAEGRKRRFDREGYSAIFLGGISYFTSESDEDVAKDLEVLRGNPRVWVLISHGGGGRNAQRLIASRLDQMGVRRDVVERPGLWGGSAAYLYDLSAGDAPPADTPAPVARF